MDFLKEKEGCNDNSKESEVQRSFRKLVRLPGLLSPGRGGTCVWEEIFLSYRRGVG